MIMNLSEATQVKFPLCFRDVHYMALLYKADKKETTKHLEKTGLKPALYWLGKPVVAVGLIQYKDSDLGAYDEIIVSVPVVLETCKSGNISNWLDLYAGFENRKGGQYIIHIPVTSQVSVDGGRNLWGYPKILAPLEHHFTQNKIDSQFMVSSDNVQIQWQGQLGMGIPIPAMNLMTYSFLNGSLMKTHVDVKANMKWFPFAKVKLNINSEETTMAKDMKAMGLDRSNPIAVLGAEKFSARFHAPEKIN
jgi:hypothetical protein